MLRISFLLLLLSTADGYSQRELIPTEKLHICGEVHQEHWFGMDDLDTFQTQAITDLEIKNNEGVVKNNAVGMRGILLIDLLQAVQYRYEKPRELNLFFFVLMASDGYQVVYSWNELYNSETGNHVFLITEKDGKKINQMDERLLILSASDTNAGRRYVKGVETILVSRFTSKKSKGKSK